jgi:hypothetical protein
MRCREFKASIPGRLRGERPGGDSAAWERHRQECPSCGEEWDSLLQAWRLLEGPSLPGPSPDLRERIRGAIREEARRSVTRRPNSAWFRRHAGFLGMAALLLLAIGFGAGVLTKGWGLPLNAVPAVQTEAQGLDNLLRSGPQGRLIAVALLSQGGRRDAGSVGTLLTMVERDPSPELRMAALDALYLYGDCPGLVDRLEASLPAQTSPRVQAAQVDLLLSLREKRALEALRRILRDPESSPQVRERIQAGLGQRL